MGSAFADLRYHRWLYQLFLAIDACFRLKRKRKARINEPEIGSGWAFFVEEDAYQAHLKKYDTDLPEACI